MTREGRFFHDKTTTNPTILNSFDWWGADSSTVFSRGILRSEGMIDGCRT